MVEKETRKGGESVRCEGEGVVILKRVARKASLERWHLGKDLKRGRSKPGRCLEGGHSRQKDKQVQKPWGRNVSVMLRQQKG